MMIGGKPGTIVITKPGTPPTTAISGKPASTATIAQLIQAGGKPTTIAGILQSFSLIARYSTVNSPNSKQNT